MSNESLKVAREQVLITLSFFDDHREEVTVFLPEAHGDRRSLVSRLLEFFNDRSEAFVSVRHRKGANTIIIRKSRVRWVELEQPAVLAHEDRTGLEQRISIVFPRGDMIRGRIFNDLPSGRQRVRDYLNEMESFFFLQGDFRQYLVNRVAASRVYDPPVDELHRTRERTLDRR